MIFMNKEIKLVSEERMDWDEVVKQYPDKWVLFYDFEDSQGNYFNGLVVCVCTDDELNDKIAEIGSLDKIKMWSRTTPSEGAMFVGVTFASEIEE